MKNNVCNRNAKCLVYVLRLRLNNIFNENEVDWEVFGNNT